MQSEETATNLERTRNFARILLCRYSKWPDRKGKRRGTFGTELELIVVSVTTKTSSRNATLTSSRSQEKKIIKKSLDAECGRNYSVLLSSLLLLLLAFCRFVFLHWKMDNLKRNRSGHWILLALPAWPKGPSVRRITCTGNVTNSDAVCGWRTNTSRASPFLHLTDKERPIMAAPWGARIASNSVPLRWRNTRVKHADGNIARFLRFMSAYAFGSVLWYDLRVDESYFVLVRPSLQTGH